MRRFATKTLLDVVFFCEKIDLFAYSSSPFDSLSICIRDALFSPVFVDSRHMAQIIHGVAQFLCGGETGGKMTASIQGDSGSGVALSRCAFFVVLLKMSV